MNNYWWAVALSGSLLSSLYIYANQLIKMPGAMLMVYRGLGFALLCLPFIVFFPIVPYWQFYALCTFQGLIIAFDDYRLFRSSKAFGAEVTAAVQPMTIGLIFMIWLIFKPGQFLELWSQPLRFAAIIICLAGITLAILKIRKAKAGGKAFGYLLPVLFAMSLNDVINKQCMSYGSDNLPAVIYYYCLITGFVCGGVNLVVYARKKPLIKLFMPRNLISGLVIIVAILLTVVAKNLSMYLTPNPAYASAIILTYPLWIIFANNLYSKLICPISYTRINMKMVLLLLASVIGLVVTAQ